MLVWRSFRFRLRPDQHAGAMPGAMPGAVQGGLAGRPDLGGPVPAARRILASPAPGQAAAPPAVVPGRRPQRRKRRFRALSLDFAMGLGDDMRLRARTSYCASPASNGSRYLGEHQVGPEARSPERQEPGPQHGDALKMRTYLKKVSVAIEAGDREAAEASYKVAMPVLDSMVNKGIVHKNKAARHKSRLNARIKSLSA